jgi:hypothetical protein
MVAGDFNATRDVGEFRRLLRDGYRDAAEQSGAGLTRTHPADIWLPPVFAVDHILTPRRDDWRQSADSPAPRSTSAQQTLGKHPIPPKPPVDNNRADSTEPGAMMASSRLRSARRSAAHNYGRDCPTARATKGGYSIIEDEDGPTRPRISAVNATDVEIAGAFQPPHMPYWLLYVTPLLAAAADVDFHIDHLRLQSREEARQWVDLVAHLYVKAAF